MRSTLLFLLLCSFNIAGAQNAWTQKANFAGPARDGAVSFTIGTKGYVGTGIIDTSSNPPAPVFQDLWEYDPSTDTWTQKANFAGVPRGFASGFAIGNKGYIGLGYDGDVTVYNDFWEYDPAGNSWVQKANFPAAPRGAAGCFSVGSKGYIATGRDITSFYQDLWEYDQAGNSWVQKAAFPGAAREGPVSFTIGSKSYIGTGRDINDNRLQDFWEYDPVLNAWLQKAVVPGSARGSATGFAIGTKGYIGNGSGGSGSLTDWWEWDQASNSWTQKANFPGAGFEGESAFAIGTKGYVCIGYTGNQSQPFTNECWEFDPNVLSVGEQEEGISVSVFPNPFVSSVTVHSSLELRDAALAIYDMSGKQVRSIENCAGSSFRIDRDGLPAGVYFYELRDKRKLLAAGKFIAE
ncbi:MAG: Kelch repeat type 1-containing protein [Bacteroidetes bacterium]|nr:MAG: Kelch repeat type 1-containing protein [Bacteroidota bacterium]